MANETLALDLDLFDTAKSGYAPAMQPEKKQTHKPKLLKEKPMSKHIVQANEKQSRSTAAKACAFAFVTLLFVGALIFCRVIHTNYIIELNKANTEYAAAQSEYTALQMERNSRLAPDKVEEIAREKLGMVKRENYQIKYFDMSGSDGAKLPQ